jgi:hypothetical protein
MDFVLEMYVLSVQTAPIQLFVYQESAQPAQQRLNKLIPAQVIVSAPLERHLKLPTQLELAMPQSALATIAQVWPNIVQMSVSVKLQAALTTTLKTTAQKQMRV